MQAVIELLHAKFFNMGVFNATKVFSLVTNFASSFFLEGFVLVDHYGCIFELKNFVDILQVSCSRLKMHHA